MGIVEEIAEFDRVFFVVYIKKKWRFVMNAVNKLILCCCLIYVRNNINSTASEIVEKHKNVPQLYAEHLNDYIDYFNCKFEERIFDDSIILTH